MNRRTIALSLLCLPLIFSCSPKKDGEWFSISCNEFIETSEKYNTVIPFNTQMKLSYFKKSDQVYSDTFEDDLTQLFTSRVIELHKLLDRHYYYFNETKEDYLTNVKIINDSYATGDEIICSDELYNLLKLGYQLTLETNGYFNFFMGNLTTFWDNVLNEIYDGAFLEDIDPFYNENQKNKLIQLKESTPTIDEVKGLLTFNDEKKSVIFNSLDDIYLDEDKTIIKYDRKNTVSRFRPYITSGGIAKGYATDLLKELLNSNNYYDGFLNSGSSSLTSLSAFSFTKKGYHTISVVDPRSKGYQREVCMSLNLYSDYALSTSGNYTNGMSYSFKDQNSNKTIYRHHIINPYTGECSQEHASVTLISNSFNNGQLDALSTAFVNMSTEEGFRFRQDIIDKYSLKYKKDYDLNVIYIDIDENNNLNFTLNESFKDFVKISKKEFKVTYA